MSFVTSSRLVEASLTPCPYCTRLMDKHDANLHPSRDHILPKSKGGKKLRTIIVCVECNKLKRDQTLEEFLVFLRDSSQELDEQRALLNNRLTMIDYLVKTGLS